MRKTVKDGNGRLFDIESPMAIELRRIMIRLGEYFEPDRSTVLMVTSAERGEGKSLFSLHFTLVLAHHLKQKVLLVDGDVRRPVQHTAFQVPRSPGLSESLAAGAEEDPIPARSTQLPNLSFLPAGTCGERPSRLMTGARFREVIDACREDFGVIVVDAPPVVPVSDPLHFLDAVDGVIYLIMAGRTTGEVAERGVGLLRDSGANLLGVVANNVGEVLPYYYDQKYYGYGNNGKKKKAKRPPKN